MRLLGYAIVAVAYVAVLWWLIDKRNPEVEASPARNEVRDRTGNEVRPPRSAEPKVMVRVVPVKTMDELCADRSKLAGPALDQCDRWEKSKARSPQ